VTVTVIQPDATAGKDCSLWQYTPTTNYEPLTYLSVGKNLDGRSSRSLLRFDLSSIDAGEVVDSAVFSAGYYYDDSGTAGHTQVISAYRLLRDWTESGATWRTYDGSHEWGTYGVENTTTDREAAALGSFTHTYRADDWSIALDAAKVQEWIAGTTANYGFVLRAAESENMRITICSSDYATEALRPKLTVTHHTAEGGAPVHLCRTVFYPQGVIR